MTSIERRDTDTSKSYAALCDYAAMGAGRSLEKLAERYRSGTGSVPPTKRVTTLKDWSRAGEWQTRVASYDAAVAAEERDARDAALAERRAAWIEQQMDDAEVLALLADHARGTLATFLRIDGAGDLRGFDFSGDKPLHLLKKASVTKRTIKDLTEETVTIELYDAQAALVHLGKHHKLFTDNVQTTGDVTIRVEYAEPDADADPT